MSNHVMLDIETLGTRPGDIVLSAGLVRFDPQAGVQTADELRRNSLRVNFDSQEMVDRGFTFTVATLKWWMDQSKEAQISAFYGTASSLDQGLSQIQTFFQSKYDNVWANGANFDPGMVEAMFEKAGLIVPWKYTNVRCYRTINKMFSSKISGEVKVKMYGQGNQKLVAHDPVDDCIYQIRLLQAIGESVPDIEWG